MDAKPADWIADFMDALRQDADPVSIAERAGMLSAAEYGYAPAPHEIPRAPFLVDVEVAGAGNGAAIDAYGRSLVARLKNTDAAAAVLDLFIGTASTAPDYDGAQLILRAEKYVADVAAAATSVHASAAASDAELAQRDDERSELIAGLDDVARRLDENIADRDARLTTDGPEFLRHRYEGERDEFAIMLADVAFVRETVQRRHEWTTLARDLGAAVDRLTADRARATAEQRRSRRRWRRVRAWAGPVIAAAVVLGVSTLATEVWGIAGAALVAALALLADRRLAAVYARREVEGQLIDLARAVDESADILVTMQTRRDQANAHRALYGLPPVRIIPPDLAPHPDA